MGIWLHRIFHIKSLIIFKFFLVTQTSLAEIHRYPYSYQCYDHNNIFQPFKQCFSSPIEKDDLQKLAQEYQLFEVIDKEVTYGRCHRSCRRVKACEECQNAQDCEKSHYCHQCHLNSSQDFQVFDLSLDPRCTYRSLQKVFDASHLFLDCGSSDEYGLTLNRYPPCLSKPLHYFVHNALTQVSACFHIDARVIFTLTLKGATTHPLLITPSSRSTATGLMQITDDLVKRVNPFYNTYKYEILDLLPNCQEVQDHLASLSRMTEEQQQCPDRETLENCPSGPFCQKSSPYLSTFYIAMGYVTAINDLLPQLLNHRQEHIEIPEDSPFYLALSFVEDEIKPLLENLAKFQVMSQEDQKIIIELAFYALQWPVTSLLFQIYLRHLEQNQTSFPKFEDFTGSTGAWVSFLKENREQIHPEKSVQDEVIGFLYTHEEQPNHLSLSAKLQALEKSNTRNGQEPIVCRPY